MRRAIQAVCVYSLHHIVSFVEGERLTKYVRNDLEQIYDSYKAEVNEWSGSFWLLRSDVQVKCFELVVLLKQVILKL